MVFVWDMEREMDGSPWMSLGLTAVRILDDCFMEVMKELHAVL